MLAKKSKELHICQCCTQDPRSVEQVLFLKMFQAISDTKVVARASMSIIKDLVHVMKTYPYDINDLLFSSKLDAYRMIKGEFIGVDTTGSVWSENNSIPSNKLNDIKIRNMDLKKSEIQ